jgi:hypothetical protein
MTKGSRKCDYTLQTLRLTWLCISLITILLCAQSFKLGFHDLCSSVGLFCLSCASVQLTVFSALMFICVYICPCVCSFVCLSFFPLSLMSLCQFTSFLFSRPHPSFCQYFYIFLLLFISLSLYSNWIEKNYFSYSPLSLSLSLSSLLTVFECTVRKQSNRLPALQVI